MRRVLPPRALRCVLAFAILMPWLTVAPAHANPLVSETAQGLTLGSPIVFDLRSGTLDPSAAPILDAIANAMRRSSRPLEVGVHTDSMGSEGYNQARSQAVADVIRRELIARGLPAAIVVAVGYGESQPIAPNTTTAGREANRRVELRWTS